MSLAHIEIRSSFQRVQIWISSGLQWAFWTLFCSLFYLILALDQTPLGPDFKRAVVACLIAGLASVVFWGPVLRSFSEASSEAANRFNRWCKASQWLWPTFFGICMAALITFTIVLFVGDAKRDSEVMSKAEAARVAFVITEYGNQFDRADVNQTLAELHEAYLQLSEELPDASRHSPISVHLFRNLQEYHDGGGVDWSVGSVRCLGKVANILVPLEESLGMFTENDHSRTPMHEMVHARMCQVLGSQNFHSVPLWFHEGMAQLYQTDGPYRYERLANRFLVLTKQEQLLPPRTFCGDSYLTSQGKLAMFYRSTAEFINAMESKHGTGELVALIQDVQGGQSFDHSLQRRFGANCEELYSRWVVTWAF